MVTALASLRRLAPERKFIESSAVLFIGSGIARVLGFLFSVASARFLLPADYGVLAYALGVIGIASALPYTAPTTLARSLAAEHSDSGKQDWYFSNWLVLVFILVMLSAAVMLPFLILSGVSPGIVAAITLNLFGAAVLEGYMGAARGLEVYARAACFYVLANAMQLVVVVAAGLAGRQSSLLFLLIYGTSSSMAVLIIQTLTPLRLKFKWTLVSRGPMLDILKFMGPLLFQTVFYAGWFGADLLFLRRVRSEEALGAYAAAKVIMNVLILAPTAIGGVQLPRIARVPAHEVPQTVARTMALTAIATILPTIFLALFGEPIAGYLYGGKYPLIGSPMPLLALGTGLYCFYGVLTSTWVGLGYPRIYAITSGIGMTVTLVSDFFLVPTFGLVGAAGGFALGSGVQLALISGFTVWKFLGQRWNPAVGVSAVNRPQFET